MRVTASLIFSSIFDSSVGRGDFAVAIGTGKVIKGKAQEDALSPFSGWRADTKTPTKAGTRAS